MPIRKEVKSILNKSKKRDPWFLDDYTINPYSGCSFNCLYCYIRGSKYGMHMEEKLTIKTNAIELLEKQLSLKARKNQHGIIVVSSATDPYLQFEKEEQLTRQILEVILKYRFPVHIITKSDLVVRDFDLLKKINESAILPFDLQNKLQHKAFITFSFSTISDETGKIFEPGATLPSQRMMALKAALENNLFSGVSMMPLIPYITDTEVEIKKMLLTFKEAGAHYIFPASITLFGDGPADSRTLVFNAIRKYYPHLLDQYEGSFKNSSQIDPAYRNAFDLRIQNFCKQYNIKTRIME
jgi:DNA repair photolyase